MESDESGSSQDSSHSSASSNYKEKNEELSASNDRIDQHGDGCEWVEPYSDELITDTNWVADYRAKKQNRNGRIISCFRKFYSSL